MITTWRTCTSSRCTWIEWAVLPILFWAAVVFCSLWWNIRCLEQGGLNTAASVGRSFFKEIQVVRLWNARHGGVYVPITEESRPSPFLKGPNRDVSTLEGLQLTKITPEMMTRQTAEIAREESNVQYHITSLRTVRPESKADEWETRALRGFRDESDEIIELDRAAMVYRYMAPLPVKEACLQCHAEQGYQVGDMHGGISISIPAKPYLDAVRTSKNNLIFLHAAALLLGTGVFLLLQRWHNKQMQLKVEMSCALEQAKTAEIREEQGAVYKAFSKTAQYLAGLSARQNPWSELGKAIISFFDADFVVFGERSPKGEVFLHDWSSLENTPQDEVLAEEIREEMADVIESGFLATHLLPAPSPCVILSLPMTHNNQTTAVISIGHYRSTLLSRESVNLYLSVAGLAGTMIARLKAEKALTKAHDQLDNRVKERTAELFIANKRLRSEITERERIEQEMKAERDRLQTLMSGLTAAGVGVNVVGADYGIVSQNEVLRERFGDAVGKPCYSTYRGKDRPCNECRMLKTISTGSVERTDLAAKDGRQYEILIAPLANMDGSVESVVEVFRDITERKKAEEELKVAKEKAEAATRIKSEFLANMSHELRTPLSSVLGYSQLMQKDSSLRPEQREYLNTINRSGEHLLVLINDILEISKIEAGRITLNPHTIDLQAMLRDLYAMFKVRTDAEGLTFELSEIRDLPRYVVMDGNRFRQVLINLLGNAVKFTHKGGIAVRVSARDESPEKIRLVVEVEDTGPGIAEDELDKIFGYFEQSAAGRKNLGGTGLGLAISRDLTRKMGGEVTVTSRVGAGSTFRVEVDVKKGKESDFLEKALHHRVVGLAPGQGVPRILVAEDEKENRTLLVRLLKQAGFNVREAENGEEAIALSRQWQPHFVWMDIRMPVTNGLEAARRIKADGRGGSVRIAALTAGGLEEERDTIFAAGCDDFVRKPFREPEIFQIMAKHLGLKYLYEEEDEPTAEPGIRTEPDFRTLRILPTEMRDELLKVVLELDMDGILEVVEKIGRHDPPLGAALKKLANNLDYSRLLALLEGDGS